MNETKRGTKVTLLWKWPWSPRTMVFKTPRQAKVNEANQSWTSFEHHHQAVETLPNEWTLLQMAPKFGARSHSSNTHFVHDRPQKPAETQSLSHLAACIHSRRIPGSHSAAVCPAGSGSSALRPCRARSCREPERSERDLQDSPAATLTIWFQVNVHCVIFLSFVIIFF